jgi:hypothetical protein
MFCSGGRSIECPTTLPLREKLHDPSWLESWETVALCFDEPLATPVNQNARRLSTKRPIDLRHQLTMQ